MRYAKRGAAVRWENGTLVHVTESGTAIEENGEFRCFPDGGPAMEPVDPVAVETTVSAIHALVTRPVRIERLIVGEGVARHETDDAQWTETSRRVHLSLVRGQERALLDLGAFALGDVEGVVSALARCDGIERPAPPRLRLEPAVTAAILPLLAGLCPPNVQLWQTAVGLDGRGAPVEDVRIEREPWPNWYRPSYRVRPVRMPMHLRLECSVTAIDPARPVAVALLAPARSLAVRVLVDDGDRAWPATMRLTRIDAVGRGRVWYPYGAGSFGAELML